MQISTSGGDSPLWSPDGREPFYRNGEEVMAVSLKMDPTFKREAPKRLFHGPHYSSRLFAFIDSEIGPWDISPDGKRFLMMKESEPTVFGSGGPRRINVVVNWFEELKQRVPIK